MPDEEWIKTLADGRKVKFIYQELPVDGAFLTAQLAGNEVVYRSYRPKQETRLAVKVLKAILRTSFQRRAPLILGHSAHSYIFRNCAKWDDMGSIPLLWWANAA